MFPVPNETRLAAIVFLASFRPFLAAGIACVSPTDSGYTHMIRLFIERPVRRSKSIILISLQFRVGKDWCRISVKKLGSKFKPASALPWWQETWKRYTPAGCSTGGVTVATLSSLPYRGQPTTVRSGFWNSGLFQCNPKRKKRKKPWAFISEFCVGVLRKIALRMCHVSVWLTTNRF